MAMASFNNKGFTNWILSGCCYLLMCIEIAEAMSGASFVNFIRRRADMIVSDRHRILTKRQASFLLSGESVDDVINRAVDNDLVSVNITEITGSDVSSDTNTDLTSSTTTVSSTVTVTSQSTSSVDSTASNKSDASQTDSKKSTNTQSKKASSGTSGNNRNLKTQRKGSTT